MTRCLSRLFLALALAAVAAPALAQSGDLAVQATVANGCRVTNAGPGIDVPYDIVAATNAGSAVVKVRCTKNINFRVAADAGLHSGVATSGLQRAVVSGGDAIGYKLSIDNGTTEMVPATNYGSWASAGRNADVSVTFYAHFDSSTGAGAPDPAAGTYTDTVQLTFTPIP